MLKISDLCAGYGGAQVLHDLNLDVRPAEILCVMGRNGAGKTTLLRAIMGQLARQSGHIILDGTDIQTLPAHQVPRLGIGYVPQGRRLFGELTVAENMEIGLQTRGRGAVTRDRVLQLFPRLRDRLGQISQTLSGGEQQMLAIARALCLEPKILLLDEPSEGLQPSMIRLIGDTVRALRQTGVAIVLVEQRVAPVLDVADRVAFIERGTCAEICDATDLNTNAPQFQRYVGV